MSIPENWEEELMLHSWKMMELERCIQIQGVTYWKYRFPNGITVEHYHGAKVSVSIEFGGRVESVLEGWKFKKKIGRAEKKNGELRFDLPWRNQDGAIIVRGEFEDLFWDLYSLDL